jgi:hypothetical protein
MYMGLIRLSGERLPPSSFLLMRFGGPLSAHVLERGLGLFQFLWTGKSIFSANILNYLIVYRDREWQKWPVPIITGAYIGYVVGKLAGAYLLRGMRIEFDEPEESRK